MAQWAKCTHTSGIEFYVNLGLVQTLTWESSKKSTVIRFSDDFTTDVKEKPTKIIGAKKA
jgi:hypothetical protein